MVAVVKSVMVGGVLIAPSLLANLLLADNSMPAKLQSYLDQRIQEFDEIPAARREQLQGLIDFIAPRADAGEPSRLTFICTHNSRRSQMAQVWAAVAARHFGIEGVESFSGGTEITAFNPRTVAALERAGLKAAVVERSLNSHYLVTYHQDAEPLDCFSKLYDMPPNPRDDYCAVMTCSDADEECPLVPGSAARISLPYVDPKEADDTPAESQAYDERCRQICREMLYMFSQVKAQQRGAEGDISLEK
jgi:arsenate reductase (thioredoxin)